VSLRGGAECLGGDRVGKDLGDRRRITSSGRGLEKDADGVGDYACGVDGRFDRGAWDGAVEDGDVGACRRLQRGRLLNEGRLTLDLGVPLRRRTGRQAVGDYLGQRRHCLGYGGGGGPPAGHGGVVVQDADGVGRGSRQPSQRRFGRWSADAELCAGGSQGGDLLFAAIAGEWGYAVAAQVGQRPTQVAQRGARVGARGCAVVRGPRCVGEGVEQLPERGGHQRGARSARWPC
jgi:hypothetical protein